jgi:hypothetical protein
LLRIYESLYRTVIKIEKYKIAMGIFNSTRPMALSISGLFDVVPNIEKIKPSNTMVFTMVAISINTIPV